MGVDVDQMRIEVQIEHVRGMPSVIEHIPVSESHGIAEEAVAHAAAVHEPELLVRLSARCRWQADPTAQAHGPCDTAQRHRPRQELRSEHCGEARLLSRGVDRGRVKHAALAMPQPKADIEARQRKALHPAHDVAELGGLASHELAPRRHIEEEVADLDAGAARMRRRPRGAHAAAVDTHFASPILTAARARQDAQTGN